MTALGIASFCGFVYAATFVADWAMRRRRRSSARFHAKFVRPAELRVERKGRAF